MKKLLFLRSFGVISARQTVWLALFLLGETFLSKGKFWAVRLGSFPPSSACA